MDTKTYYLFMCMYMDEWDNKMENIINKMILEYDLIKINKFNYKFTADKIKLYKILTFAKLNLEQRKRFYYNYKYLIYECENMKVNVLLTDAYSTNIMRLFPNNDIKIHDFEYQELKIPINEKDKIKLFKQNLKLFHYFNVKESTFKLLYRYTNITSLMDMINANFKFINNTNYVMIYKDNVYKIYDINNEYFNKSINLRLILSVNEYENKIIFSCIIVDYNLIDILNVVKKFPKLIKIVDIVEIKNGIINFVLLSLFENSKELYIFLSNLIFKNENVGIINLYSETNEIYKVYFIKDILLTNVKTYDLKIITVDDVNVIDINVINVDELNTKFNIIIFSNSIIKHDKVKNFKFTCTIELPDINFSYKDYLLDYLRKIEN